MVICSGRVALESFDIVQVDLHESHARQLSSKNQQTVGIRMDTEQTLHRVMIRASQDEVARGMI